MPTEAPINNRPQDLNPLPAASVAPPEWLRALGAVKGLGGAALPPQLFLEAVEQAPLAISITDTRANILYANPAFERTTGYARQELIGQNESILSNRATPKEVYRQMWESLAQGRRWSGLLVNRHKDGSPYLAELDITPVLGPDGETSHFLGLHRDVSEVHQLTQGIRNQKALLERVMDAAPFALALLDLQGSAVLRNRGFHELEERIGQGRLIPAVLKGIEGFSGDDLAAARRRGETFSEQELVFDPGGSGEPYWFSCSGGWIEQADSRADHYFEAPGEQRLLLVINDISALKRQQERARRNAMRALMAEHEMSERIREALSGAMFQLQSNLNLAHAAAGMLERRGGQDPLRGVLVQLIDSGNRALDALRQGAPAEPGEPRGLLNLNQIVRDVLGLMTERMLAEGIEVEWSPEAVLPSIHGLQTGLRCAIKQLVANAIDAMSEPDARGRLLRVSTHTHGNRVLLRVQDQGPGIPEELRFRVFEPFFTAWSAPGKHTGVGLSAAREMFARHGGEIEIDPNGQEGCRVVVSLPLADGREAR